MRTIYVAASGGAASTAAFAVSQLGDGLLAAAAFVVALFVPVITAGILLSAAADAWLARPRLWTSARCFRPGRWLGAAHCGGCRRRRLQLQFIWVCERCDRAPAW